jgi:hypothetical protein
MYFPTYLSRLLFGWAFSENGAASWDPNPPSTTAVQPSDELVDIRSQLCDRVRKGKAPSLVVGVMRRVETLWAEGLGWADREAQAPATVEPLYPVASVSKSITATGALTASANGLPLGDVDREQAQQWSFKLWQEGQGLRGVSQVALIDDRPRFGHPYLLSLSRAL